MDILTIVLVFAIGVSGIYILSNLMGNSVPGPSSAGGLTVPDGFKYVHSHDGTSFAVNPVDRKVFLSFGGHTKIISYEDIRSYEWKWQTPTKYKVTSTTLTGASQQVAANRSLKRQAYEQSGLFISIADIDTPRVQIRFYDENTLMRYFEILNQISEGRLV